MKKVEMDFRDVQGLVRGTYTALKHAVYFVAQIRNAAAARAWLANQKFTPAHAGPSPETALQVAFTFPGLRVLGISDAVQAGFSTEFRNGMTGDKARSRRLGDVGRNDPETWAWGGPGNKPDILIMLFAQTAPALAALEATVKGEHWADAFHEPVRLSTREAVDDHEPFGFKDGVSQPKPDWERRLRRRFRDMFEYKNVSALGEFLLGYPNEYARYTDRPLVSRSDDPDDILLPAEDLPDRKDFARNGTYLVMRDLAQDVDGFRAYTDDPARQIDGKDYSLAEAMIGRRKSGDPILPLDSKPIGGADDDDDKYNRFTFRNDPDGVTCPFGAHIRRANPRTADLPDGTTWLSLIGRLLGLGGTGAHYDLLESVRFHRILRRGREYGPLTREQAGEDRTVGEKGLRFICVNANILRQFEFVQNSWIANPKFNGLDESDPLLGNRQPLVNGTATDTFTWPQDSGINRRYDSLPAFVTVRGGAYFFMPGLRTLRYICKR